MPRIYVDGIYDLFHEGHLDGLQKAKNFRENTTLIIGVIGDEDATKYKRPPIMNENERFKIISAMSLVDEVIFPAPLHVSNEFLERHNIDIVLHGFSNQEDFEKQKEFFKDIECAFYQIPYSTSNSTSAIIEKIKNQ